MQVPGRVHALSDLHLYDADLIIHQAFQVLNITAFAGPSKNPSVNIPRKVGSGAWGIPRRSDSFHASSDVSLFSSSLPVLPHEKCIGKFLL